MFYTYVKDSLYREVTINCNKLSIINENYRKQMVGNLSYIKESCGFYGRKPHGQNLHKHIFKSYIL